MTHAELMQLKKDALIAMLPDSDPAKLAKLTKTQLADLLMERTPPTDGPEVAPEPALEVAPLPDEVQAQAQARAAIRTDLDRRERKLWSIRDPQLQAAERDAIRAARQALEG